MTRKPAVVKLADEQVDILVACRIVGMDLPDTIERSAKVHCPFGEIYHSDHGVDPAMRIYPQSNSAWCFSCSHYYTPTLLVARAWDVTLRAAATALLQRTGYRPPSPQDVWDQVVAEPAVDRTALAEALKTFCRRAVPHWDAVQFEPDVSEQLDRCLRLLDLVHDEADGRKWLSACKMSMLNSLASHPFEASTA